MFKSKILFKNYFNKIITQWDLKSNIFSPIMTTHKIFNFKIELYPDTQMLKFVVNNKFNQRYTMSLINTELPFIIHNTYSYVMDNEKKQYKKLIYLNKLNFFFKRLNEIVFELKYVNVLVVVNNFNGFFLKNINNFSILFKKYNFGNKNFFLFFKKEFFNISNKKFKKIRTISKQKKKQFLKNINK